MDYGSAVTGLVLCSIWVGCVVVFGLAVMFARAEYFERPLLVGGMTLLTAIVALALLYNEYRLGLRTTTAAFVSIGVLAAFGYGIGRILDLLLGPQTHPLEETEPTLGADLAD